MSAQRAKIDLARIEVGEPRPAEIQDAIAVAARALADSPMTVAVVGPDLDRCYRQIHRFFVLQFRLAPEQRPLVARLDGRIVASTNDLIDGACHATPLMKLRALPAFLAAGPRTAARASRWFGEWERRDPVDRPHSHFGPFGVEPELQGLGIGSLVLAEYTRRLDAAGEDAYLETEKPENVALYGRFGFEVTGEADILGVRNWFMWREAGADAPATRATPRTLGSTG
jgi:ribosomal protein S18 acetylase RimI-like enzyme